MSPAPLASIVITTKDRKEDLRQALGSCLSQTAPVEVLVIDDGSSDGTTELVHREFPTVRCVRHVASAGYIQRRNEGAAMALAPYVVSIDDDATFAAPDVIARTLADFDHPRIGAVAIPFCNVKQSPAHLQSPPDEEQRWIVPYYIGTAHAVRRELFLKLGGYRQHFVHQGEEGDYCLRLLASGHVVRLGRARLIHHFESPRRSFARLDFHNARNLIQFTWHNVPMPQLLLHLPGTTFNCLRSAVGNRRVWHPLRGLASGYGRVLMGRVERSPVSREAYRLFRRLVREGPLNLAALEAQLPPLAWQGAD